MALLLLRDKRVQARSGKAATDSVKKAKSGTAGGEGGSNTDDGASSGASGEEDYDVALLAQLVEQLSNIAPAAERQEYMYRHEDGGSDAEPVTVNWNGVLSKVTSPLSRPAGGSSPSTVTGTELTSVNSSAQV